MSQDAFSRRLPAQLPYQGDPVREAHLVMAKGLSLEHFRAIPGDDPPSQSSVTVS